MTTIIDSMPDYDCIMIECKDKVVTKNSLVCVSPYSSKRGEWMSGLNEITTMANALKSKKKKCSNNENVILFMDNRRKNEKKTG